MDAAAAAPRRGDEPLLTEPAACSSTGDGWAGNAGRSAQQQQQHQQQQQQQQQRQQDQGWSRGWSERQHQGAGHGPGTGRRLDPPLLSSLIARADSVERLGALYAEHGAGFNGINYAAAITRLPKVVAGKEAAAHGGGGGGGTAHAEQLLGDWCAQLLPLLSTFTAPRQCCNIIWALGKLPDALAGSELAAASSSALVSAAVARLCQQEGALLRQARPQELANLAHGLANLGWQPRHDVWLRLVQAASEQLPGSFRPQEAANLLWALATSSAGDQGPGGGSDVGRTGTSDSSRSAGRGMLFQDSSTGSSAVSDSWGSSDQEQQHQQPQQRQQARPPPPPPPPQQQQQLQLFPTLRPPSPAQRSPQPRRQRQPLPLNPVLLPRPQPVAAADQAPAASHQAQQRVPVAGGPLKRLVDSLGRGNPSWLAAAKPQELANMAWALAVLDLPPRTRTQLAEQVAGALAQQQHACSASDLALLLWACPRLHLAEHSAAAAAAAALAPRLAACSGEYVTAALGACAGSSAVRAELLDAVLQRAEEQLPQWPPSVLAALISACSRLLRRDGGGGGAAGAVGAAEEAAAAAVGEPAAPSWQRLPGADRRRVRDLLRRALLQLEPATSSSAIDGAAGSNNRDGATSSSSNSSHSSSSNGGGGGPSPRDITTVMWACGWAGVAPPPAVLGALQRAAPRLAPRQLALVLWAAGRLRLELDFGLWDALEAAALPQVAAMSGSEVPLVAYACTRLRRLDSPLLDAVGRGALARPQALSPQGVALVMWAFACARHYQGPLTSALVRSALGGLGRYGPAELANLLAALAGLKYHKRSLFAAAAVLVQRQAGTWPAKSLARVAAAYAAVGHLHWQMFEAIGDALAGPGGEAPGAGGGAPALAALTPHELTQLVQAFAAQQHRHERLLGALAAEAAARAQQFVVHDLCALAVAMAQLQHRSDDLLGAITGQARARTAASGRGGQRAGGGGGTPGAAGPAGSGGGAAAAAVEQLYSRDSYRLFRGHHWERLAWAYSTLGHPDEELFMLQLQRQEELRNWYKAQQRKARFVAAVAATAAATAAAAAAL